MPTFENFSKSQVCKLMLIGDSGSGKTGSLASLAAAGYNVRIADLDNGVEVLADYLTNPESMYKKPQKGIWTAENAEGILQRVRYETLTDKMRNQGGKLVPKAATVWTRLVKLLDNWETETDKLGPVSSWTPQDVLVIDSFSFACKAAMAWILMANNRASGPAQQSDWYAAQGLIESLLQTLYDEGVNCNVIVTAHVKYSDSEPRRGEIEGLGKALTPKIGRYFNSILMAQTVGVGAQEKRKILTKSTSYVELKNPAPLRVQKEYDLGTGLAEYFRDVKIAG